MRRLIGEIFARPIRIIFGLILWWTTGHFCAYGDETPPINLGEALDHAFGPAGNLKTLDSSVENLLWILQHAHLGPNHKAYTPHLEEALTELDFKSLRMKKLTHAKKPRFDQIFFSGHSTPQQYLLDITPNEPRPIHPEKLLDFQIPFAVQANPNTLVPDETSFSIETKPHLSSAAISHRVVFKLLSNLLLWLDPENLAKLAKSPKSTSCHHSFATASRPILSQLNDHFPASSQQFCRFFTPEIHNTALEKQKGVALFSARITVKEDALEKDYPELAEYLRDIASSHKISLTLKNSKKQNLAEFEVAPYQDKPSISIGLLHKKGLLIPYQGPITKRPRSIWPEDKVNLLESGRSALYAIARIQSRFAGLTIDSGEVLIKSHFAKNDRHFLMNSRLQNLPLPRISGHFLHFIPLDASIDVNDFAPGFRKVLLFGNEGKGVSIETESLVHNPKSSSLKLLISMELLDNFITSFITHAASDLFPNRPVRAQLKSLLVLILKPFRQDLALNIRSIPHHKSRACQLRTENLSQEETCKGAH